MLSSECLLIGSGTGSELPVIPSSFAWSLANNSTFPVVDHSRNTRPRRKVPIIIANSILKCGPLCRRKLVFTSCTKITNYNDNFQ